MKYSLGNNVLHGFPSANAHPHVASKNLLQDSNSDIASASHWFCLAMKAFVMADFLDVDEHATDICGVHIASEGGVSVLVEGSTSSGNSGNSMIAVILVMNHMLIFLLGIHTFILTVTIIISITQGDWSCPLFYLYRVHFY